MVNQDRMLFVEAIGVNPKTASDTDLVRAWHSYANQISYHHADDSGKEWGSASALMPRARQFEGEIRNRGLERPVGAYLMSRGNRIDWETGDWSPGWDWEQPKPLESISLPPELKGVDLLVEDAWDAITWECSQGHRMTFTSEEVREYGPPDKCDVCCREDLEEVPQVLWHVDLLADPLVDHEPAAFPIGALLKRCRQHIDATRSGSSVERGHSLELLADIDKYLKGEDHEDT